MAIQSYKGRPKGGPKKVRNGGYSNAQLTAGLDELGAFIALLEGFLPTVTRDELANGLPTIGFGATSKDVIKKYGKNGITLALAKELLKVDINNARNHARRQVGENTWKRLNKNLQDALTSYAYNFPFLNSRVLGQEKYYSPKMIGALREGNWREAARQMDAGWNQAAGLRKRRMLEQEWFLRPTSKRGIAFDDSVLDAVPDDFEYMQGMPILQMPQYAQLQPSSPVEQEYIPIHMPQQIAEQTAQLQEYQQPSMPFDFSALFLTPVGNQYADLYMDLPASLYYPIGEDYSLPQYEYGKDAIHIDPENRGKFNETMRRTGKTAEELSHSKNPLTRKRAIFALNARKWNH